MLTFDTLSQLSPVKSRKLIFSQSILKAERGKFFVSQPSTKYISREYFNVDIEKGPSSLKLGI